MSNASSGLDLRRPDPASVLALILTLLTARAALPADPGHSWGEVRPLLDEHGNPFQEVRDILEDRLGAFWMATWGGGVSRIDRATWTRFNERSGLPGNWCRCLALTDDGRVWIGSADGLARVREDDSLDVFTTENVPAFPSNGVRHLLRLADGSLWISFDDAPVIVACRIRGDGSLEWSRVADASQLVRPVRRLHQAADGSIWAALEHGGLQRLVEGHWSPPVAFEGEPPTFRMFAESPDGRLRALSYQALWELVDGVARRLPEKFRSLRGLALSPDGTLFAVSSHAIQYEHEGSWKALERVPEQRWGVLIFSRDRRSVWLGAREGLFRSQLPAWRLVDSQSNGHELVLGAFCAQPDGPPYCVDADRYLVRREEGEWRRIAQVAEDEFAPRCMLPPRAGAIWALTEGAVLHVGLDGSVKARFPVPRELTARREYSGPDKTRLFSTSEGELLLVASSGVLVFDGDTWRSRRPEAPAPEELPHAPRAIDEAPDGALIVGLRNLHAGVGHVERWKDGRVERLGAEHPLLGDCEVEAVHCASDGWVWIGTEDEGVLVWKDGEVRSVPGGEALASDMAARFLASNDGTLWVGLRSHGVTSLRDGRWVSYTQNEGIPRRRIRQIVEADGGEIWIEADGSGPEARSLLVHRPDREGPDTRIGAAPEMGIASHGVGVFSFSGVDAWGHTPPERLCYSWRIRPRDSDPRATSWSPSSSRTSFATDSAPLAPGRYVFEVRAEDLDRNVDPSPARVEFSVESPLVARPAFLVLAVIAASALLVLFRQHLALRQSHRELRRENAERERAESANRMLETELRNAQKLEAVGVLAAKVAHDFNNVLTVIVGYADLLRRAPGRARTAEILAGIDRACAQAEGVTGALLTFSRDSSAEKVAIDLRELLRSSLPMVRRLLTPSVRLVLEKLPASAVWVEGDATQLEQVLVNLAVNSRDAMPSGGTLRLAIVEEEPRALARLLVEDTGTGIPESLRERVLEPFFTTKERGRGTGLGLAIAAAIVRDHGGAIEIDSGVDGGTRVTIVLPRVSTGSPSRLPVEPIRTPARGEGKLLVAEDDASIRSLLVEALISCGFEVEDVADGEAAVRAFSSSGHAGVILDVDMPLRNGFECLREIRSLRPETPAILISGVPGLDTRAWMDDRTIVLAKPFPMLRAVEGMHRLLRAARDPLAR